MWVNAGSVGKFGEMWWKRGGKVVEMCEIVGKCGEMVVNCGKSRRLGGWEAGSVGNCGEVWGRAGKGGEVWGRAGQCGKNGCNGCGGSIKEERRGGMRDTIVEKWRQTVTDVWRTLGGGEKEKYTTGDRYVITLNKGL